VAATSRDKDRRALDRRFRKLLRRVPLLRHLGRGPRRITVGVLLVLGGFLGFLPILGFWMLPLGLALLAQDVPPLRRPLRRALVLGAQGRRRWRLRARRRACG
jgi:hypothetical protein